MRVFLQENRHPSRREHPTDLLPQTAAAPATTDLDHREDLRRLLDRMPPRQRAVLALRYYDDLSIEQTAEVLGCSAGAVKSLTGRTRRSGQPAVGSPRRARRQSADVPLGAPRRTGSSVGQRFDASEAEHGVRLVRPDGTQIMIISVVRFPYQNFTKPVLSPKRLIVIASRITVKS